MFFSGSKRSKHSHIYKIADCFKSVLCCSPCLFSAVFTTQILFSIVFCCSGVNISNFPFWSAVVDLNHQFPFFNSAYSRCRTEGVLLKLTAVERRSKVIYSIEWVQTHTKQHLRLCCLSAMVEWLGIAPKYFN